MVKIVTRILISDDHEDAIGAVVGGGGGGLELVTVCHSLVYISSSNLTDCT